jgi:predicted regulator of Ras-like GTPase activity (Roadblock/LC7/MglB family)
MTNPVFQEMSERVRDKVRGFRALAVVSLDGIILDQVVIHPVVDDEALSEYATLLRISDRTSQDTRMGELMETVWIADRSVALTRRVSSDSFPVLVSDPDVSTGLARYALKQVARRLRTEFESVDT